MKTVVVSAYVPLKVKHLSPEAYMDYGKQLEEAVGRHRMYRADCLLQDCWLAKENPPLVPATEPAADRYDTKEEFALSNIIQHSRTEWALQAVELLQPEVVIWLDLAIMKQGDFTGKRITSQCIREFMEKIERRTSWDVIPFPGITPRGPIEVHGNNWRFCGSTHVWPVKFLREIDRHYKFQTRKFIREHKCIPLDLAIWPAVEVASGLPFEWYKAEYDTTQLTGFPDAPTNASL